MHPISSQHLLFPEICLLTVVTPSQPPCEVLVHACQFAAICFVCFLCVYCHQEHLRANRKVMLVECWCSFSHMLPAETGQFIAKVHYDGWRINRGISEKQETAAA